MLNFKHPSLLFFFLFCCSFSGSAQEVIDLIANASCECIEELEDVSDFSGSAEICIQQAIFSNLESILTEFDFSIIDEEDASRIGEEIGTKVGLKLFSDCPTFMEMMMSSDEFESEVSDNEDEYEANEIDNSERLTGIFLEEKITKGGFSYLIIEDEYGDKTELLWIYPFQGDELVGEELKGSTVTVRWKPTYIRNGKEAEYIKTKVISGLAE